MKSQVVIELKAETPTELRRLRLRLGLGLEVVANAMGVDYSWLSRAERGLRGMTAEEMERAVAAITKLVGGPEGSH